jgi:Kef-type K+ transport system membrane component KefB
VIGEIVGGILLGPSVLGRVAQFLSGALSPELSGVIRDIERRRTGSSSCFSWGMSSIMDTFASRRRRHLLTGTLSIFVPFAMAACVAPLVRNRFASQGISGIPFLLLLGISMSITAVPVLARILREREMQSTALGTLSLICAALNDVCAWLLLAVALTMVPYGSATMPLPGGPVIHPKGRGLRIGSPLPALEHQATVYIIA